jgi:RsbT co-antagonist protein rsbRD N-terminal domain
VNEKALSKFGDYLLSRRDKITADWVSAVQRKPSLNLPSYFGDSELADHLPELFQDLAVLLKAPQSQRERSEVSRTARSHGKYRWRQGYKLDQVIHEASIIRRILVGTWVSAFAWQTPDFDDETRRAAEQIIHEAVDDIVADSAEQYMEEQQKAVSHLNVRLADALAELRQQKAATESNKPKEDISGDAKS